MGLAHLSRNKRALRKLETLEENYDSVSYMIPYALNSSVRREIKSSLKAAYSGISRRVLSDLNEYLTDNVQKGLTVRYLVDLIKEREIIS